MPISSPHIPPTPVLPSSSVSAVDFSLIVGSLFEGIEDHISLEEVVADWKRWRECSTEEWLKGADSEFTALFIKYVAHVLGRTCSGLHGYLKHGT